MIIQDNKNGISELCKFIEKWAGPRKLAYGIENVPNDLPYPLQEIYRFAGNWPHQRDNDDSNFQSGKQARIFQEQDCLYGINNIKRENNKATFLVENQGNWTCLPKHQSKGIGRLLFREILSVLKDNKVKQFCLDSGYKRAQVYWAKLLGDPQCVLKDYWQKENHHMIWYKDLESAIIDVK